MLQSVADHLTLKNSISPIEGSKIGSLSSLNAVKAIAILKPYPALKLSSSEKFDSLTAVIMSTAFLFIKFCVF